MAGQTVLEVPKLRQRNVAKHRPDPEKASEGYAEPDGSQTSSSNPPHLGSNESNELECEFSRFLLEPPPSIGEERRTRSQTLFTTPLEPDDMAENQVMNESSRGRFRSRVKQKGPRAQSSDTLLENVVVPDEDLLFKQRKPMISSIRPSTYPNANAAPVFASASATRIRKRDIARPYVEKGIMSGIIYMMGEAIACGLVYRNGSYGFYPKALFKYSVLHSALVGAFANGPMLQLFFQTVDYWINFESRLLNVVAKVLVDQVVWGCLWNGMYILLMNIATDSPGFGYIGEGLGLERLHVKLFKGFMSAFWKATNWRLHVQLLSEGLKMLPMDILCYWVVPLQLRPLWVAAVDTLWVTILSQYD